MAIINFHMPQKDKAVITAASCCSNFFLLVFRFINLFLLLLFFSPQTKAQVDASLLNAIRNCDSTAIENILKQKTINVNAVDSNGANELMCAALECQLLDIKILVNYGAIIIVSLVIYFNVSNNYESIQSIVTRNGKVVLYDD